MSLKIIPITKYATPDGVLHDSIEEAKKYLQKDSAKSELINLLQPLIGSYYETENCANAIIEHWDEIKGWVEGRVE